MKKRWPLMLLIPLALAIGWFGASRQAREQTAFLERVADALEHAQTIPPETEHAVQNTIASVRWRAFPSDEKLEMRQNHAIGRIEAVLYSKGATTTGNVASRQLPRYVPSE